MNPVQKVAFSLGHFSNRAHLQARQCRLKLARHAGNCSRRRIGAQLNKADPPSQAGQLLSCQKIDKNFVVGSVARYVAVDDVGRAVNPMIVHGQTMGAVAQGLGQALFEHCIYECGSGQLLNGSMMDYSLPRAEDLPNIETWLDDTPTRTNALGVKGAGEAGTVAAPCAAISAVLDALAPLGVTHIDMPATPARVWAAIEHARRAKVS